MSNSPQTESELKNAFLALTQKFSSNEKLTEKCWEELVKNYSGKKRHYHTLQHLLNLFAGLEKIKEEIRDHDALFFALYYHDVIYNVKRSDNEEKSAALAAERMNELGVPEHVIALCKQHILATKTHVPSGNTDTDHFTDADLSVLGSPWETYEEYYRKIRKEYSIYPDFMYNPGRKKVLAHFLSMSSIFKTEIFISRFEKQARENLARESALL